MDLPTYTNIWRIEKRLYKLYDFRLPMPLPVGQIAVFAAIAVPYAVALTVLGLPFSHTLLWLYLLPPGALAWLATRPVLESKRLPELVISQLRYLGEPRTWCRMAPLAEKDEITITCRVWRRGRAGLVMIGEPAVIGEEAATREPAVAAAVAPATAPARPASRATVRQGAALAVRQGAAPLPGQATRWPGRRPAAAPAGPAPAGPAPAGPAPAGPAPAEPVPARSAPARPAPAGPVPARPAPARPVPAWPAAAGPVPAWPDAARPFQARPAPQTVRPPEAPPAPPPEHPVVTVLSEPAAGRPLRVVERALNGPSARRGDGWRDHVVVVPGGHRPGRPDQQERDRARARGPLPGSRRIVVLGCTVGAGQTVTTLMTGEVLASLRGDQVAVLDLNPGHGSLAERARTVPAVTQDSRPGGRGSDAARESGQLAASRLEVISGSTGGPRAVTPEDVGKMIETVSARYPLTLADPAASAVPRALAMADQLVLVAPATADAASAIAMTYEWLEAHGRATLATAAITVLNGVSRPTMRYVEQAEAVASGRCRAIVRVPWDDSLNSPWPERMHPPAAATPRAAAGVLTPAALHAYTALAGVLIAGLADAPELRSARI